MLATLAANPSHSAGRSSTVRTHSPRIPGTRPSSSTRTRSATQCPLRAPLLISSLPAPAPASLLCCFSRRFSSLLLIPPPLRSPQIAARWSTPAAAAAMGVQ